jgi:hypothetical protein
MELFTSYSQRTFPVDVRNHLNGVPRLSFFIFILTQINMGSQDAAVRAAGISSSYF